MRESKFVTIKRPLGMLRGVGPLVPGNFVLQSAETGAFALRANPSPRGEIGERIVAAAPCTRSDGSSSIIAIKSPAARTDQF